LENNRLKILILSAVTDTSEETGQKESLHVEKYNAQRT